MGDYTSVEPWEEDKEVEWSGFTTYLFFRYVERQNFA
jgi:hypothetical protein